MASHTPTKTMAPILREKRKAMGINQQKMALMIGQSPGHFSMVENGTLPIPDDVVKRVLHLCEFTPEETVHIWESAWVSRKRCDYPVFASDQLKILIGYLLKNHDKVDAVGIYSELTGVRDE